MPSAKYRLGKGSKEVLLVSWNGLFENLRIIFDGQEIEFHPNKSELATGKAVTLPNGEEIQLQISTAHTKTKTPQEYLILTKDGIPLVPLVGTRTLSGIGFGLGIGALLVGLFPLPFLPDKFGTFSLVWGIAMICLGFIIRLWQLWMAVLTLWGLFIVGIIALFLPLVRQGNLIGTVPLLLTPLLILRILYVGTKTFMAETK